MTGLHFPQIPCPECEGTETYDVSADDAPLFQLECRFCSHEWEQAGLAFALKQSDHVEGHSKSG